MHWYLSVLKNYVDFDGRARRSEYWYFTLFNLAVCVVLALFDILVSKIVGFQFLRAIYSLAVLLPALGVSVRRLHDTNRSGWWLLLAFVPLVNFALIWFLAQDSEPSTNRYGMNPKLAIA